MTEMRPRSGPEPSETPSPDVPLDVLPVRRRRGLRLSFLPTMCTLGNSIFGFLAICYAADASRLLASDVTRAQGSERLVFAGWMLVLGIVCDMLDGRIARLTRSTSSFGGALDSLADVVSFGMAPALIAKVLCQDVLGWHADRINFATAAFFGACATLRLARYNAEHEEPDQAVRSFRGLPTPGAAAPIIGLALSHEAILRHFEPSPFAKIVAAQVVSMGLLTVLGLLMVSKIPYIHFANRFLSGRKPVGQLALFVLLFAVIFATEAPDVVLTILAAAYAFSGPIAVLPRIARGRREVVPELFD